MKKGLLIMIHTENKGHSYSICSAVYVSKCLYQTPHWYPEDVLCVPRSPIEEEKSREAVSMITTLAKIFGVIKGLANCSGEICMTSRLGLKQLWISLSKSQYKATQCTAQKFHTCSYRIYSGLCAETERGFFSKSRVKLVLDVMEINFTWGFGFVRN